MSRHLFSLFLLVFFSPLKLFECVPITRVRFQSSNITLAGINYQRLRMTGEGPQWKNMNGIEGFYINEGDHLNIEYYNDLSVPDILHIHGQIPFYSFDGTAFVSSPPLLPGDHSSVDYLPKAGSYFAHSHFGLHHDNGLSVPFIVAGSPPPSYRFSDILQSAADVVVFLEDFCPYSSMMGTDQNPNCFDVASVYQSYVDYSNQVQTSELGKLEPAVAAAINGDHIWEMGMKSTMKSTQLAQPMSMRKMLSMTQTMPSMTAPVGSNSPNPSVPMDITATNASPQPAMSMDMSAASASSPKPSMPVNMTATSASLKPSVPMDTTTASPSPKPSMPIDMTVASSMQTSGMGTMMTPSMGNAGSSGDTGMRNLPSSMGFKSSWDFNACTQPATSLDIIYRYHLANGRILSDPQIVTVQTGQALRIRIVNSASMSNYYVEFDGLNPIAISVDGEWIQPDEGTGYWVGVAQRLDVLVKIPRKEEAKPSYLISATTEFAAPSRSGVVLAVQNLDNNTANFQQYYSTSGNTVGNMDNEILVQEARFHAFRSLINQSDSQPIKGFTLELTGAMGFMGINGTNYVLPPYKPDGLDVSAAPKNPGSKTSLETTYQGTPAANSNPLVVNRNDRVCLSFVNKNGDPHPMHLHGHNFQVTNLNGIALDAGAVRDTVIVPRGQCPTIEVCFNANNPGVHGIHCHLQFHMMDGMFTTLQYPGYTQQIMRQQTLTSAAMQTTTMEEMFWSVLRRFFS